MKAIKPLAMLTVLLTANLAFPLLAQAESLDSLNQKEQAAMQQGKQISVEVQMALNDVNSKYQEVSKLKAAIEKNEATIKETDQKIQTTSETIEKRKQIVAERMKEAQVKGSSDRTMQVLLDAESLTDFVNRAYAMSVLQSAEKSKVLDLDKARKQLEGLKEKSEQAQASLKTNEASLEQEAQALDTKVATLKTELSENQSTLDKIAQSKTAEKARVAADNARKAREEKAAKEQAAKAKAQAKAQAEAETKAKAAAQAAAKQASEAKAAAEQAAKEQAAEAANAQKEAAAKAAAEEAAKAQAEAEEKAKAAAQQAAEQAEKPSSSTSSSEASTPSTESSTEPSKEPEKQPGTSGTPGKTMMMESTGYSIAEPGMSHLTATGLDLSVNPQAIAVDPSVIPLNSIVEVQGYGVAIAADTGGAIHGNIIDCHFPTVQQCIEWGRRQVQVTIMS